MILSVLPRVVRRVRPLIRFLCSHANTGNAMNLELMSARDALQQAKRESDPVAAVEKLSVAVEALLRHAEEQDRRRDQEAGAMAAAAPKI